MDVFKNRFRENEEALSDWKNLPTELLDLILEKLFLVSLSGYIRFGAVCKGWHSVAIDHHRRRLATNHRMPPMLLITQEKRDKIVGENQCGESFEPQCPKLYSINEGKVYNLEIKVPHGVECLGASYSSWLAIEKEDFSITLFNPFTRKSIQMPGLPQSHKITKAILSHDPSTCPDDFVLAAIYKLRFEEPSGVAFTRAGQKYWTILLANFISIRDIIFHKGLLYAMDAKTGLLSIDCRCLYVNPVKIVTDRTFSPTYGTFYLAEASNGDLLFVHIIPSMTSARTIVYKLESRKTAPPSFHGEDMDWVEIRALENNDTIFLVDNHSLCVSKCKPNSIYLIRNFKGTHRMWLASAYDVFVLRSTGNGEAGTAHPILDLKRRSGVQGSDDHMLPVACLSPTIAEFFELCSSYRQS